MSETVVNVTHVRSANGHHPNNVQEDPSNLRWIQFNVDYFLTHDGILKLVQLVLAIICMSLASPAYHGGSHFFLFVVIFSFIMTVMWCFVYFLGIKDVLNLPINWLLSEFINYSISSFFYVAAVIVQLSTWLGSNSIFRGSNITAGFFGFLNMLAYAYSSYLLYLQYKFSKST